MTKTGLSNLTHQTSLKVRPLSFTNYLIMDSRLEDSESSKSKLDKVLNALTPNISAVNDNMDECVEMLNQSFSNTSYLSMPEENHKDLKESLEILCRLPSLFFQFSNNFNAVGSMDTCSIIEKYNKVAAAIEETNEKLAKMVHYYEKCLESVID